MVRQSRGILQESMIDYKFYANDQQLPKINYNIISGILPQDRVIYDIKEAYDYDGAIIVIDSSIHKTHVEKEIFEYREQNNKKTRLLVDYAYETGLPEEMYDEKVKQVVSLGIDIKDTLFLFNRSAFSHWMEKHIDNIFLIDLFAVSAAVRHAIGKMPVSNISVKDRPAKINFLVGKIDKPSRSLCLQSFYKDNIRNSTMFSILGMPNNKKNLDKDYLKFLEDNQGPVDDAAFIKTGEGISSQGWSNNCKIFDETSVSFICETHETNNSLFVTEKTYRPIINRHPFVARASFPLLEYLRAIGFRTFDQFVDESYDSVSDVNVEHINTLISTAKNLLDQTSINADKIQEIVDHNYETLIKFAQSELALFNRRIFGSLS